MKQVSPPPGIGLIATVREHEIKIGTPDTFIEEFPGRAPISWSPSGFFLAWGAGQIYDVTPWRAIGGSVPLEAWTWSPNADCLVGVTSYDSVVVRVAGRGSTRTLVTRTEGEPGPVPRTVDFSSDGRFLRVTFNNGKGMVLDLRTTSMVRHAAQSAPGFESPRPCTEFGRYVGESCSPDGSFFVARRGRRVYLSRRDGSQSRTLAAGPYIEDFPEWGPQGTGVLFLRKETRHGFGEVWFVPEGGTARRTPFSVDAEGFGDDAFPWYGLVDWNVSPPHVLCGVVCVPT